MSEQTPKRRAPELTDKQIDGLLERALGTPEAAEAGLVRPPNGPFGWYTFTKASGDGDHDKGDCVTPVSFRDAMQAVIDLRGNYGDDRAVVGAYWDMLKKPCDEWAVTSILALARMAPLQGVLNNMRDWGDDDAKA